MFISVYAIAKDEEAVAQRWYNCFKEADEVCVLDTCSSDKTVRILRKLGARVRVKKYKEWRFDVARNDSMKLCSSKADLLFCADLDDVIESGWRQKLESLWKACKEKGLHPSAVQYTYSVKYLKDGKEWLQKQYRHNIHTPYGWKWKFRVHEQLVSDNPMPAVVEITDWSMTSDCIVEKDHTSYLRLLELDIEEFPNDERIVHLLGREYMNREMFDDAIRILKEHVRVTKGKFSRERSGSLKFLAECYRRLSNLDMMELNLWKAYGEDEEDKDASFMLGKYLLENKFYREAYTVLKRCVSIEDKVRPTPSYCPEAWSAMPYFYLAESAYYVGDKDTSLKMLDKGLEQDPNNGTALKFKEEVLRVLKGDLTKGHTI